MTGKPHTWRELIYLGTDDFDGWYRFAAESDSQRLAGRGGMGHLVRVHPEKGLEEGGVHCTCPAFSKDLECWHELEVYQALVYWRLRLAHGALTRETFEAFYGQWWPKHSPITERCRKDGEFKGKSATEWEMFFSSLLDEWNARSVAYGKLERTFGKDLLAAVLSVEPQKEEAG